MQARSAAEPACTRCCVKRRKRQPCTPVESAAASRAPVPARARSGTRPEKLRIQKWYNIYKDHITLEDYEIHDGMGLELYYN